MTTFIYFLIAVVVIILILWISGFKIIPQSFAYVIERFGSYRVTWQDGLHWKMPFFDRIVQKVLLKEQVIDFNPQPVITRDNVTMQIDTVVYFQITDPKLFAYGVNSPLLAIENLTATTLRNIIGELELDETLTSRDLINTKMRVILDEATDPWGIKINRVEVKNILPPRDIQEAMEKQMRAERERRAVILNADGQREAAIKLAEGEKRAQILRAEADKESQILSAEGDREAKIKLAEGEKRAQILRAEADKESQILSAEGDREAKIKLAEGEKRAQILRAEADKESQILSAEGDREAKIRRAEGDAQAILKIQTATAEGLMKINESKPTNQTLT
jgi:regulator of protease activity HflC (stomatin/prohibitin superfamily)